MVTKTFFRKVCELREDLEKQIVIITQQYDNIVTSSEGILLKIDESIRELKKLVKDFTFESIADEVQFFKEHKPYFISRYIYYSAILHIETSKPQAGDKSLRKFYESELLKLKTYYAEQIDFYNYYRRKATYLDHKYFARRSYDLKMKLSTGLYNLDEDFNTSHDHKIAIIQANELLENFVIKSIRNMGQDIKPDENGYKLAWTSSKVSLIELIYALHRTRCFNGGNVDFSEVVRFAEKWLEIDLGNCYKTIGEIKSRKYTKTKFLQLLTENLDKALEEGED
ncbi:RteC domain-containing protein [Chryseobacterium sp. OSA05B]|uniref:RteC domain-containing protein n=1 Tax=Chryseobacterium sp. OSA05B TaxID=2862650 RepID=UPI001CBBA656|nr:RteC domain-containing protein [Chryseobacterium sp. OSA05B]